MATADAAAFDRATDMLLDVLSVEQARAILTLRGDDSLQRRIDELATRNNNGELTADELAEYQGYVRANKFIAILQAKARRVLGKA